MNQRLKMDKEWRSDPDHFLKNLNSRSFPVAVLEKTAPVDKLYSKFYINFFIILLTTYHDLMSKYLTDLVNFLSRTDRIARVENFVEKL